MPNIKFTIRVNLFSEVTYVYYNTLISVISLIGGLALGVYRPLLLIIHYFTSRHYFARIIRELYAVRQSTNEFIKANKIENSNNLHNSN